jgi:hypothetical protein
VPKFGDWDSNPASADGYTHIFNKVREEKSTQAKAPAGFDKDAGPRGRGNGPRQHDDGYVSSVSSTVHYLMLSRRGHWHVHAGCSLSHPFDRNLTHSFTMNSSSEYFSAGFTCRAAGALGGANRNGLIDDGARISGNVNCVKLRRGLPLIRLGDSCNPHVVGHCLALGTEQSP